ncbi:dTDP-4-dehydrorhamnose reductase [Marinisporobacter balticus]|uniref:dTDP-4-dehydrorhamnose reductase n=1 Tax=Marinisporobacter balticus TaxID=2018667 RepID=A0A4R2KRL7_9FIRM|nr:dTDP-4-dehydrorhamnose reductase [Marinisporobacter balticus]TCO73636.1 dTDP-4-dehydrorhamnose reductase [Marinisporobacter balticus]
MKILITGRNGQLGSAIIKLFNEKECPLGKLDKNYFYSQVSGVGKDTLDITSLENVKDYFMKFRPDIVINTAAYTNVDGCESNIDLAFQVNALGPKNLAIACEEIKAKLIHISTDYVFDGQNKVPYREFDLPSPINIYGKSKYFGEEYVKQFCSKYFILRTGWLYGYTGKNFVKTILKVSKEKSSLEVINDQIGSPTNAEDLVYHILELALTDEYGIYHCTGNSECSWYEFAKAIIQYAHIDCKIHPISSYAYKNIAKRPPYSSLDPMMLRCTIGDKMRHWQHALKDFINTLSL